MGASYEESLNAIASSPLCDCWVSADTGISETGEKTRRVRYVRFAVYFHMRAQEQAEGSLGGRKRQMEKMEEREIEEDKKDSTYVRRRSSLTKLCSSPLREYPAETED
ncbi:hypothetical protein DMN91_003382 [Ooceraea biroi]|uniref:Uncharacterized protein n=1 Tax=Ooceraea biroi TaxID=2015173 RepID=A0A3L8DZC1_OOCBI|nr:hypothetical protein DMN91_003382 [Ooceraea biroi]